MNYAKFGFTIVWLFLIVLMGCGKSEKQIAEEKAFDEALTSLKKVSAAVEIGVTYQVYGTLIIDAKAKVNEANSKLSDENKKSVLNEVINAYADAGKFWGSSIKSRNLKMNDILSDGKTIEESVTKYNFQIQEDRYVGSEKYVDNNAAMQKCWAYASLNLAAIGLWQSQNQDK